MKLLVVFAAVIAVGVCQRPIYAGTASKRYPEPLPQFTQATEAPAINLGDRAGGLSTEATTTIRLPIDARGDADLFKQIASWPRDRQPYWFINWQSIEASRARPQPAQDGSQASINLPSRSSFLSANRP